jgi:hypothetical protein
MSKHTPGPWEVWDQYIRPDYRDDKVICQWGSYTSEADAHLIAAAPDMLAALKLAVEIIGADDRIDPILNAIAKAEGAS